MKKILLIITFLSFLSGCANSTSTTIKKDNNTSGIHEISYDNLQKKLSSEEQFILYIGRPDCGDCKEFYPILQEYITKNAGTSVYYINVKAFRDASRKEGATKEEKDFFENMQEELEYQWTPTLKYVDNGKFMDSYTYLDEDFYKIKEEEAKKKEKQAFVDSFIAWMDAKFE